jgi:hypothetical protein
MVVGKNKMKARAKTGKKQIKKQTESEEVIRKKGEKRILHEKRKVRIKKL